MSGATLMEIEDQGLEALQVEVTRMAKTVCMTADQAILEGIDTALAVAAEKTTESADKLHEIAAKIVSRAQVMQTEVARFLAVSRGRTI